MARPMKPRWTDQQLKDFHAAPYVDKYERKSSARLRRLLPYFDLRAHDVVADFGCGNGMLAELIHGQVERYVGVDFSEPFIAAARRRAQGFDNVRFECADLRDFCARHPQRFDKAFTLDFSEHVYDDAFESIYSAIRATLKPGGVLYLHTPNGEYFLEVLKDKGVLRQFPEHIAVRTAGENVRLLGRAGFEHVEVRHLAHYIAPLRALHPLAFVPGLGRFFRARLLIVSHR